MRRIKIIKILFIFVLFIFFMVATNHETIIDFYMATITFNSVITVIFAIGMIIIGEAALHLTMLAGTFGTMEHKKGKSLEFYLKGIKDVMPAYIAFMFEKRVKNEVLFFSELEAKSITEWLENKFHNQKSYTAFFIEMSLMVGLFGTFVGLLESIDKMAEIILSFGGEEIDLGKVMMEFSVY